MRFNLLMIIYIEKLFEVIKHHIIAQKRTVYDRPPNKLNINTYDYEKKLFSIIINSIS